MPGFTSSTHIDAPVETVFALASDFAGAPGRIKGIKRVEMLTEGPVGVGTRFRETRQMFGKEAAEEMELAAFEPNRSYTLRCQSCGSSYTTVFCFEPEGAGTNLVCDFQARAQSWISWLLLPLGYLMMGAVKKCIQDDIDDIKRAAEAAPKQPASQ